MRLDGEEMVWTDGNISASRVHIAGRTQAKLVHEFHAREGTEESHYLGAIDIASNRPAVILRSTAERMEKFVQRVPRQFARHPGVRTHGHVKPGPDSNGGIARANNVYLGGQCTPTVEIALDRAQEIRPRLGPRIGTMRNNDHGNATRCCDTWERRMSLRQRPRAGDGHSRDGPRKRFEIAERDGPMRFVKLGKSPSLRSRQGFCRCPTGGRKRLPDTQPRNVSALEPKGSDIPRQTAANAITAEKIRPRGRHAPHSTIAESETFIVW